MGKYRKISLVIFYVLQLLLMFKESLVMFYEGAIHLATEAVAVHEDRFLVFFAPGERPEAAAQAVLTHPDPLDRVIRANHHHLPEDSGEDGAEEKPKPTNRRGLRRLALMYVRNLYPEMKRAEPRPDRSAKSAGQKKRYPRIMTSRTS